MNNPSSQLQSPNFPNPTSNPELKQYTPQYSPQTVFDSVKGKSLTETQRSGFMEGAGRIAINKDKVQAEVCANIMLGLAQVKEGVSAIKSKKDSLTKDDWDSDSDESYKEYVENYLSYMTEVEGFFEALSKKIINDAETFEEMDNYINHTISSGINISNWR